MRISSCLRSQLKGGWASRKTGATLVEVLVGLGLLGIMATAMFGGMSNTIAQTRAAREELRATQIMVERMEGIRLFNWDQLNYSNTLCPTTFTTTLDPSQAGGLVYYGTMLITNANLSPAPSYSNSLRSITVTVDWTNFGLAHHRSMMTFQSQYGMQNYVFSN